MSLSPWTRSGSCSARSRSGGSRRLPQLTNGSRAWRGVLVGSRAPAATAPGSAQYLQSEGSRCSRSTAKRVERRKGKSDKSTHCWRQEGPRRRRAVHPRGSGKRQGAADTDPGLPFSRRRARPFYNQLQAMHVTHAALRDMIARPAAAQSSRGAERDAHPPKRKPARKHHATSHARDGQPTRPSTRRPQLHQRNHEARQRTRSHTAGRAGVGPICAAKLFAFNPHAHQRGSIRTRQRTGTTTSVLRQNRPSPPQPRRRRQITPRSTRSRCSARHHAPHAPTGNAESKRARPSERPSLPQATLSPTSTRAHKHTLDNIEASTN